MSIQPRLDFDIEDIGPGGFSVTTMRELLRSLAFDSGNYRDFIQCAALAIVDLLRELAGEKKNANQLLREFYERIQKR